VAYTKGIGMRDAAQEIAAKFLDTHQKPANAPKRPATEGPMEPLAYLDADSSPLRTPVPTHRGQRSSDRGQFLTVVQA
ncbi:MAG: hypothetical protein ACREV8_03950, partial [Gammaproteobacteria bacterium]